MLLSLLRSIRRRPAAAPVRTAAVGRVQDMVRLATLAAGAPLDRHLEILFGDVVIAGLPLETLMRETLAETRMKISPDKVIHRRLTSFFLGQYFLHSLSLDGRRAECGVFAGTSARFMCRAARARDPRFDGSGMHLVDSFEGISAGGVEDRIDGLAESEMPSVTRAGALSSPVESIRRAMADFPGVSIHKGWIPQVLAELPEDRWAFVHVDVDLYAPTRAVLEYFEPRLVPGGAIVCDDYGSALFPGARRAWDEYCKARELSFVMLPTGQSVLIGR